MLDRLEANSSTVIEAGIGWEPLWAPVLALADRLRVRTTRIRELWGELRFEFDPRDRRGPVLETAVNLAQDASTRVCHVCGEPGKKRQGVGGLVIPALCSLHFQEGFRALDSSIADALDAEVVSTPPSASERVGNGDKTSRGLAGSV